MKRVVITGMGLLSPIGNNKQEFFDSLAVGKNGINHIANFDAGSFPVRIAGEVKSFDFAGQSKQFSELAGIKDRKVLIGFKAAFDSIADTRLNQTEISTLGLDLGVSLESVQIEDIAAVASMYEKARQDSPVIQTPLDTLNSLLIKRYHIKGPAFLNCSACTASTQAIGHAFQKIRAGDIKVMLAGGFDSMINPLGIGGFALLGALSNLNDTPDKACCPFDRKRSGAVLGEGAAMYVLEELEHALSRGAHIYAEILGYGSSMDAYKATDPHPDGLGAANSMLRALADAKLMPQDIHYINAHGTSTPKNDIAETRAIKQVFGSYAYQLPISSTKSMTGHLIAASGAVELGACIFAFTENKIPPTINFQDPDPECDLNYTPNQAVPWSGRHILSNSFGFGGQNATLILGRWT